MARIRRGAEFGTREARRRLRARPEPYWMQIDRGLSLGYRKSAEGGSWVMRRYDVERRRHAEARLGTADDNRDADGADALDFGQAQRKLLDKARQQVLHSSGQLYTVANAVHDYVDWQRSHRKSAADTESKLKTYVLPKLGEKLIADLVRAHPREVTVVCLGPATVLNLALGLCPELIDGKPDAVRSYLRHFWSHWSGPSYEPASGDLDPLVSVYGTPGAFTASIAWYRAGAGSVAASLAEEVPEHKIAVPTTVLWPDYDPLFPREWSDRIGEFFAAFGLIPLDGAGHFVPLEAPGELAAAISAAAAGA